MVASARTDLLVGADLPWSDLLDLIGQAVADGAERVWLDDAGAVSARAAAVGRRFGGLRVGLHLQVGRRRATVLAKQLTSLDTMLGGRVDLVLRGPAPEVAEAARIIDGLAGGEAFSFRGRTEQAEEARCLPPSPQIRIPRWTVTAEGHGFPPGRPGGRARPGPAVGWIEVAPLADDTPERSARAGGAPP